MPKVVAYLRVSTDAQDVANQQHGVVSYCTTRANGLAAEIERDFISSRIKEALGLAEKPPAPSSAVPPGWLNT